MNPRWWRSPWLPAIAALVPAGMLLWSGRLPEGDFGVAIYALMVWLGVLAATPVVIVLAIVALPRPRWRHAASLWPVLLVPGLLVGSGALVSAGVPERLTFAAARGDLDRFVASGASGPARVGLYDVIDSRRIGGCTHLALRDAGFLNGVELARCPAGVDPSGDEVRVLDPPWYVVVQEW